MATVIGHGLITYVQRLECPLQKLSSNIDSRPISMVLICITEVLFTQNDPVLIFSVQYHSLCISSMALHNIKPHYVLEILLTQACHQPFCLELILKIYGNSI